MKMVSQLTRQALRRHYILSNSVPPGPSPISVPESVFDPASSGQPSSLTGAPTADHPLCPENPTAEAARHSPPPESARPPRTIYSQLMSRHDRMNERHLPRA